MEKTDSLIDYSVLTDLNVSDIDENCLIPLPVVFTTKEIPNQDDVDEWSYLKGIHLSEIDAGIRLPIGSDVPQALEPIEFRNSQD